MKYSGIPQTYMLHALLQREFCETTLSKQLATAK